MAKNHVFYNKNEVEKGKGRIIDTTVEKKDILTVFSVHGDVDIIYICKNACR